jgi:transcriptional regulator with XRE-family HTH domain
MSKEKKSGSKKVGRQLQVLRAAAGISTAKLAEQAGISYTLLSGIENGHRPLTENAISKIATVLHLTSMQIDALRAGESLLATRNELYIPSGALLDMETQPDIDNAWLIDSFPPELTDDNWLKRICTDLSRRKYTYFLPNEELVHDLRVRLETMANDDNLVRQHVSFVTVPSVIAEFFFNPITAIWHSTKGEYRGAWAFQGHDGKIDGGIPIQRKIVDPIAMRIARILHDLKHRGTVPLHNDTSALNFRLIQPLIAM